MRLTRRSDAAAQALDFVSLSVRFVGFAVGAAVLGIGTAMVYPTLLAAIGDVAHALWRASSLGVYRLWRDLGYAIGALLAGLERRSLRARPRDVARGNDHMCLGSSGRHPNERDEAAFGSITSLEVMR